jgi:transposase-like protein
MAIPGVPFCPNPRCRFHRQPTDLWQVQRQGFYSRQTAPYRIQRFRCVPCGRYFSTQTFSVSYWLKCPRLLTPVFHQLLGCSGFRQIARQLAVAPNTIATHAARLGRHCLLFHLHLRPPGISEPIAIDGFQSFEFSQYHPTWFHVVAGTRSHFFYGFTDSELRRSGSMRPAQKTRRAQIEARCGRPNPRTIELEVAALLQLLAPDRQSLSLESDDHPDYPRALQHLPHLKVDHRVTPGKARRTPRNPLFPVNLLDLLIRHSGANHKRETIAFSKRRQSAAERLWSFLVWRNYLKSFSERKRDASPAMRLGVADHLLTVAEVLSQRLFPSRILVPERWMRYYRRDLSTRQIIHCTTHNLRYAF